MTSEIKMFRTTGFDKGFLSAPVRTLKGTILGYVWVCQYTGEPIKVKTSHCPRIPQPALFKSKLSALRALSDNWVSLNRPKISAQKYGDFWVLVYKAPVEGKFIALRDSQTPVGII